MSKERQKSKNERLEISNFWFLTFLRHSDFVFFACSMLTQKGTYKGKPVAPKNYVAAVWVNKDGKWLEASYQETPLAEKN